MYQGAAGFEDIADMFGKLSFGITNSVQNGVEEAVGRITEEGVAKIREFVETRGLNNTWKREYTSERSGRKRDRSGPGRIDSGEMLESVSAKLNSSPGVVEIAMGWLDPDSDEQYPIQFQEYGFVHDGAGNIPGMNSLEDTIIFIESNIDRLVKPENLISEPLKFTRRGVSEAF
jgi:hypothetical protein